MLDLPSALEYLQGRNFTNFLGGRECERLPCEPFFVCDVFYFSNSRSKQSPCLKKRVFIL